jgi:hypothetical protein
MRRLAALAPALALLSGCNLTFPFDVTRDVSVSGPAGDASYLEPVDLSGEEALWDQRDAVQDLAVDQVEVRVLAVGSTSTATAAHVWLALRPDGAALDGSGDLVLLEGASLALVPGTSVTVAGSPEVDALLMDALTGAGRFAVVARVAVDGAVDARLGVRIAGTLSVELLEDPR